MTFGQRLKAAMGVREMTQKALAERLSVSQSAVSEWVRDSYLPEGEYLLKMPGILGVSGHWLLTGDGPADVFGRTSSGAVATEALREELRQRVLKAVEEALAAPATPEPALDLADAIEAAEIHNQLADREAGTRAPGRVKRRGAG